MAKALRMKEASRENLDFIYQKFYVSQEFLETRTKYDSNEDDEYL